MAEERSALLEEALPFPSERRYRQDEEKAMMEVIIGLDPHKASNTIAVLERNESVVARRRFANTD